MLKTGEENILEEEWNRINSYLSSDRTFFL